MISKNAEFQVRWKPSRPTAVHRHEPRLWPVLHGPPLLREHKQRGYLRTDVQLWEYHVGAVSYQHHRVKPEVKLHTIHTCEPTLEDSFPQKYLLLQLAKVHFRIDNKFTILL